MAKRRKEKEGEEEFDFKLPKFDEKKFLQKEKRNIKATFLSFLFGCLIAVISFGFWVLLNGSFLRWELVLLFSVFNASWIRYLYSRLHFDLTDFGRRGWFSSYATYFFTWLLIFMVLVNPPFYDDEPPVIDAVILPSFQEPGGTVKIIAFIADNVKVDTLNVSVLDPNGTRYSITEYSYNGTIFSYEYENSANTLGEHTVSIIAIDTAGRKRNFEGSFTYTDSVVVLTTPENGSALVSYTPIEFKINENVYTPLPFDVQGNKAVADFRMFYKVNNGTEINVSRLNPADRENYRTTPEYQGWIRNANISLIPYIEVSHYFKNQNKKFSNLVKDSTIYRFITSDDPSIGARENLVAPYPTLPLTHGNQPKNSFNYYIPFYNPYQVPGFELLVFVISLGIVILIFKYRKKDRRTPR